MTGPKSPETDRLRHKIKDGCEAMVLNFFSKERGQVAIYDANNGTIKSRQEVGERFEKEGIHVIFLGAFESHYTILLLTTGFGRIDV